MSVQIAIAYRPGDRPLDVAARAHHLDSREDRAVLRQLALACELAGFQSGEQMALGLSELSAGERRQLLNLMRARAGLPAIEAANRP